VDGGRAAVRRLVMRIAGAEILSLAVMLVVLMGGITLVRGQVTDFWAMMFAPAWLAGAVAVTAIPFLPGVGATARGWFAAGVFFLLAAFAAVPQVLAKTL